MRLSGFIMATMLLVSVTLVAQHTSSTVSSAGFSGSSISGASHSYSGGSASSNSASSHSSSNYAPHGSGTNATKSSTKSSILSPSKKSADKENRIEIARCVKEPCPVCPPGESRSAGACVVTANVCPAGWNSFTCGSQYQRFNDCNALANQLKAEEQHMRGVNNGPDLIHQMLANQYQQCLVRLGAATLSPYLLVYARLADVIP